MISNSKFTGYISGFTASTYLMAITFDSKTRRIFWLREKGIFTFIFLEPSVIELNVKEAKKYYEKKIGQVV